MDQLNEVTRLRIYTSSTDKFRHSPLYEVIVYAAKRYGISGATVYKGIMGYGKSSEIHTYKLWELTEKLPVIVEIVDEPYKIDQFFEIIRPYFEKIKKGCLITAETTRIVLHKTGGRKNA
jgi:PII-like signaling protein